MTLGMSLDGLLASRLERLKSREQFRDPLDAMARYRLGSGAALVDACSNDYLGLAANRDHVSRETAVAGAGASRLMQGTRPEHEQLEQALAGWVGADAAILFSSGYAANSGLVPALAEEGDVVFSDALNHASLVDGCRLARARIQTFAHLDLEMLDRLLGDLAPGPVGGARWVLTESYFSMDGDGPDLTALRKLCDRHSAYLVVDEAHALGVFGREGRGRCAEAGVRPDVLVGTLGKAVGTQGAFVAGSELLRTWLWNRARTFVFSTAPSPTLCALSLRQLSLARSAEPERELLRSLTDTLREELGRREVAVIRNSFGPIVSVLAGSNAAALHLAQVLRDAGILAQPIRPPTVPEGTARVRLTLTAAFTRAAVERIAEALAGALNRT